MCCPLKEKLRQTTESDSNKNLQMRSVSNLHIFIRNVQTFQEWNEFKNSWLQNVQLPFDRPRTFNKNDLNFGRI